MGELPAVYLTPDSDQWDPHAASFADAEAAILDNNREIVTKKIEEVDKCVIF